MKCFDHLTNFIKTFILMIIFYFPINAIKILRKANLIMENFVEAKNLNIYSWLINWGYMNGYLQDG